MKIDSKQKLERVRTFMLQLKIKPSMEPFLTIEDIAKHGIYDFNYVNPTAPTIHSIDKKIKDSRYDFFSQLITDLHAIAQAVSDYLLTDDPHQTHCLRFREQVNTFSKRFQQDFKHTLLQRTAIDHINHPKTHKGGPGHHPVQHQQKKQPPQNGLSDGLQALFLLRSNQNNEAYLRSIGSMYSMGQEERQDYVLTIDQRNPQWRQLVTKQTN